MHTDEYEEEAELLGVRKESIDSLVIVAGPLPLPLDVTAVDWTVAVVQLSLPTRG